MFREERLQSILKQLMTEKKVLVADLAEAYHVSLSSIRNDLCELESRGFLKRTYGGAVLPEQLNGKLVAEKSFLQLRETIHQEEKDAIGQAVAELIDDGDTLFMDGGSTLEFVVKYLNDNLHLTIVTNATNLIPGLLQFQNINIYLTGGFLHPRYQTLVGEISLDGISRFRTRKAIIGIDGISLTSGLTATDPVIASTKSKIINNSKELIVVSDHTKLDKVCLMPIAPIERMDVLVTDENASPELLNAIHERGPKIIIAYLVH